MSAIIWIVLGFLLIISIIDWKFKKVPSIFLTCCLFLVVFMRPQNLIYGVLAILLMLLVYDLDKSRTGIADFKVMAIIGLMISSNMGFFNLAIVFSLFQVFYIFLMRKAIKYQGEIPFIPCLLAVYVALLLVGWVA